MEFMKTVIEIREQLILYILLINTFFAVIIVFIQKKEPKSVWAWLLLLYFLPVFGFFIYVIAGTDMHKKKMFRIKEVKDRIQEAVRIQEETVQNKNFPMNREELNEYSDLILYNLELGGNILTDHNNIRIFTDGTEKFEALMEDMKQAKESIHLQYYIIKNDVVFSRIRKILIEKAKEGVEVRILYDGMGCRSLPPRFFKELEKQGIKTAEFFPALLKRFHLRLNYRNHRKIVVIDGRIGYVGGFNIGKEYVGMDEKFGNWRDTHMRIHGPAVFSLQLRFLLDYNYASCEKVHLNTSYLKNDPILDSNTMIQVISCGPDSKTPMIRNNYLRLINKAKKKILIQTPYFVPDDAIMSALLIAVQSGIEVCVMIPCKPDHLFVYWASYFYIGELIEAGAKCYTYSNGFLHAKGMIVDDIVYCFGTANMDIRSFSLNFEVNIVVYGKNEAKQMTALFVEDVKQSMLITKTIYNSRSYQIRLKELISRLLAPIL